MSGFQSWIVLIFIILIIALFTIPPLAVLIDGRMDRRRYDYKHSRFERKQIRFFRREYFNALRKARFYDNSLFESLAQSQRERADRALEQLRKLRDI